MDKIVASLKERGYDFYVLVIGQNKWGRALSITEAFKQARVKKSDKHLIYAGWVKTCYADEIDGSATWEGLEGGGMVLIDKRE